MEELFVDVTLHLDELFVVGDAFVDVALSEREEVFGELGFSALELSETGFL